MDGQWLWVLLAVSEVLMVLVLLLLVSWIRNVVARRRDKRAIKALVAEARKQKDQRLGEIQDFLSSQFGMSGETLGLAARSMYKAEARLIQFFASTYLHRDARSAARFRSQVQDSTEPYWSLSAEAAAQGGAGDVQAQESADAATDDEALPDDGEVKRLRGENTRLSEELRVTMDTMSRMLTEYSTIFAKDAEVANITVVDEDASGKPSGDAADAAAVDDAESAAFDAVDDAEMDASAAQDDDPDAILAAAAVTTAAASEMPPAEPVTADESEEAAQPVVESSAADEDPDAILAAAAAAAAAAVQAAGEGDAVSPSPASDDAPEDEVAQQAEVGEAEAVDVADEDPDAILAAAAASTPDVDAARRATDDTAVDPDEILAGAASTGDDVDAILAEAEEVSPALDLADDDVEQTDASRFSVDLDSEMKDLSAEEDETEQLSEEETAQAKAEAERQRVIDADS